MISRSNIIFITIMLILGVYVYQSKIKDQPKNDHIAVIHINSGINRINCIQWEHHIRKAIDDKNAKAIILKIHSSGGRGNMEIRSLIEYANTIKPTVVYATMATSAAYKLIPKIKIFANEMSVIGSIGSWYKDNNFKEIHKYLGYKQEILSSNETINKFYNYDDPENKTIRKKIMNEICEKTFYKAILDNREIDKKYFNGNYWYGYEAKKRNFVDEIVPCIDKVKKYLIKTHKLSKKLKLDNYNLDEKIYTSRLFKANITDITMSLINQLLT